MLLGITVSGVLFFGVGRLIRTVIFRHNVPPPWVLAVLTALVFVCGVLIAQVVGPLVDEQALERYGVESSSGARTLTNLASAAAIFFFLGLRRRK